MERCPALRETSRTMRLSLFKSGGIFRVSPKRKAALSRTLVLRELYTAPKEAELSGVIFGGGDGGGEKRRTITFQKEMHGGQLEIKKLSLQLFHNSLDFRAGEQPRSLPFTESKKPTRYFSVSLPFNFPPYTVQSPDRGPVHPTDSVEIYMYVYTYIYPRARCNNAFDDLCGVSSP